MKDFKCFHHILPRYRDGTRKRNNLICLWKSKEIAYHDLFDHMTFSETIEFLSVRNTDVDKFPQWGVLFCKVKRGGQIISVYTKAEVIEILKRVVKTHRRLK